jgi:hypothetical protein
MDGRVWMRVLVLFCFIGKEEDRSKTQIKLNFESHFFQVTIFILITTTFTSSPKINLDKSILLTSCVLSVLFKKIIYEKV